MTSDKIYDVFVAFSKSTPKQYKFPANESEYDMGDPSRATISPDARQPFRRPDYGRWYVDNKPANRAQKPVYLMR